MKSIIFVGVAMILSGCAPALSVITPDSMIGGQVVNGMAIRVNSPFTFRPALYSATYPAGLYVPQFEDESGVYFEAGSPIVARTIVGGTTMSGGLYVFKSSWSDYQAYIQESSGTRKADIPVDVDMNVVRP